MEELSLQDARDFILFKRKGREAASTCNFKILPKNCKNEVKMIPYMETTYRQDKYCTKTALQNRLSLVKLREKNN